MSQSLVNLLPPDLAKPKASSSPSTLPPAPVPASAVPKFGPPQHLIADRFWSNFRDFLLERPVKLGPARAGTPFRPPVFESGVLDNLKEFLRSKPVPKGQPSGTGLEVNWNGNFGGFKERLKDALFGPKLRLPKGAKVKDIWTKDEDFGRTQAISFGVHGLLILLILLPLFFKTVTPVKAKTDEPITLAPWLPPGGKPAQGGGGQHAKIEPEKGKLPRFARQQIAAPNLKNLQPKLAAEATLLGPDMKLPSPFTNTGDPLANMNDGSLGTGYGTGIGSGTGGGYGQGEGGGLGGGIYNAGQGGVGTPVCYYQPDPQYSEEARKAKYQGEVTLEGVITVDGRITQLRVVKGLGMGLDENAIAAVRTWKCRAAKGPAGNPVNVRVPIAVTFRLL